MTETPDARAGQRSGRSTARDSAALVIGTGVNGALAYVFFALATRNLGGEGAAPVAQLWTWWSASAAVLTFPVQHWIIRTMHGADGLATVRRTLPRVTMLVVGISLAVAAASYAARQPLFLRDDGIFPLLVAIVTLGAFLVGVVRGRLAGDNRFVATGVAIASEGMLRVVLAVGVLVAGGGAVGFGLALAVGGLAVAVWPSAYRWSGAAPGSGARSPLVFLGGIAAGSLIAQLLLTGGPVVLAAIGGSATDVTALFTALALFRAPYLLTLGLVTQVTGVFTDLVARGSTDTLVRIRHGLAFGAVVGIGVAGALGLWIGPAVIDIVFGAGVAPSRSVMVLFTPATAAGLVNLVFTVLLVARGLSGPLTTTWVAAVGVAVVAIAVVPVPPLQRVAWAFLVAEVAALVLMWATERRAMARSSVAGTDDGDPPVPAG